MVSHQADSGSGAVLSNAQDDHRALEGSKSFKQPKRIREKVAKSSKQQPKSSKADGEQISKAERELCIWSVNEEPNFNMSFIKEYVGAVIESVNVAKSTLTDAQVFVIVPKGVLTERADRVLMISEMASELGVDESTFTFVEQQDLEVPAVGDVVVINLALECEGVPKIVIYKNGVKEFDQGVVLTKEDECEVGAEGNAKCVQENDGDKRYYCSSTCGYILLYYNCCHRPYTPQ